jgi:hypothetical protein
LTSAFKRAVLGQQFTHVLGAAAACRLVSLGTHPFHQTGLVQRTHAHQHAADGAVAANPVFAAVGQGLLDDRHIDRVQDDDGVLFHAQCGCGVDPVAVPASGTQFGEHFGGVVAALGADDDVAALQRVNVEGILQRGFVLGLGRGFATGVGGGEEHGFNQREVALGFHAVHQDRSHHAAPTDQTHQGLYVPSYEITYLHDIALSEKFNKTRIWSARLVWPGGARRTGLLSL